MVASGAQGVPVAVAWHTATVAPAIGWPAGPKTMSSLRDPCAAAGLAMHAAHANPSIAARITFFVAQNLFFTLAIGFIPSSRLSQICGPTFASILIRFHHPTNGETTTQSCALRSSVGGTMIGYLHQIISPLDTQVCGDGP